jgi:hypothetical protein
MWQELKQSSDKNDFLLWPDCSPQVMTMIATPLEPLYSDQLSSPSPKNVMIILTYCSILPLFKNKSHVCTLKICRSAYFALSTECWCWYHIINFLSLPFILTHLFIWCIRMCSCTWSVECWTIDLWPRLHIIMWKSFQILLWC